MGYLNDRAVAATFAAMQRHLALVEEYSYFQGTTLYSVNITMGDSAFSMQFAPAGHITLADMRIRCLPVITKNLAAIHDSTCACMFDIRESMHGLTYLDLDEDYH